MRRSDSRRDLTGRDRTWILIAVEIREGFFRVAVGALLIAAMGTSMWFRRRADRAGGGISRARDGAVMPIVLTAFGIAGAVSLLAWLIRPQTFDWALLRLPLWARLVAVGLAASCLPMFYWMFQHLGSNVTATSVVRENARLVTTGPYRFIRHPMYTFGTLFYAALSLAMDTWWMMLLVGCAFLIIAWRTQREEANLSARFGAEYERYRERTGRFFPKIR